jgi:hypothetical protein
LLRDEPTRAVLRLRLNQGAGSGDFRRFHQLPEFPRPRLPVGVLALGVFYILGAVITFIIDLVLEVEVSNGMFSIVTAIPTIGCYQAAARPAGGSCWASSRRSRHTQIS